MKTKEIEIIDGERYGNVRVYVFFEDDPIALPGQEREDQAEELKKPEVKSIAWRALRRALRKLNATHTSLPTKIAYSRKAGCSCGCSPGFIVKGLKSYSNIYVTVTR
jgi:hypothetical protein